MKLQAIILAAGKGTRMNSLEVNKCLLPINGKPMIRYPLGALKALGVEKSIVVVGFAKESVQSELRDEVIYAVQKDVNGTAKAVEAGMSLIASDTDKVIVLYGDHSAFYTHDVIKSLLDKNRADEADMTLVTIRTNPPFGYGRIIRDTTGDMVRIVEEKNATDEEKLIDEINTGNAVYSQKLLRETLPKIAPNSLTGEYYLPDVVWLGRELGYKIRAEKFDQPGLNMGVNTPDQLAAAEKLMKELKKSNLEVSED